MRVFDCFPLFNELDLLELRLNELWDVVDVFVIVEARQSFTGNPKPLCLEENSDRFAKYMPKIRYVIVEAFPEGMSNWGKEEYQRNRMMEALSDVAPEDILIMSDLDEIPRAPIVKGITEKGIAPGQVFCLSLDWHSFYLNVRLTKKWERQGPRLIRAADLRDLYALRRVLAPAPTFAKNLMRQIKSSKRMGRWLHRVLVPDAGWHFTWMGGSEAVALKGSSIPGHSSLPEGEKTLAWADARMEGLIKDGSSYALVEVDQSFPRFVRERPDIYDKYMLQHAP